MGASRAFPSVRHTPTLLLVALTLNLVASPGIVQAQGPTNPTEAVFAPVEGVDPNSDPQSVGGAQAVVGGTTRRRGGTPGGVARTHPFVQRTPRNGRHCARIGNTRTCTTYRHGRAVKVCTTVGNARAHCRRSSGSRRSQAAAANINEGWYAGNAQMGRIWLSSTDLFGTRAVQGICSGTVVGTNLVLTAGHCAYNADSGQWFQDIGTVFFDPKNQFAANGGATSVENASAPYGSWDVQRSYVPQCYVDTASLACDVGLLVMSPNTRGDIGNVVGSYPVVANVTGVGVGTQVDNAGYPAGGGFESYQNGMGNAPYFCQNALTAGSGLPGGFDGTDTGSFLQTFECPMTGGASGGPVFIKLADGQWYIWGVNNHADYRRLQTPFSKLTGTQPFGDTFLTLWRQVTGQG